MFKFCSDLRELKQDFPPPWSLSLAGTPPCFSFNLPPPSFSWVLCKTGTHSRFLRSGNRCVVRWNFCCLYIHTRTGERTGGGATPGQGRPSPPAIKLLPKKKTSWVLDWLSHTCHVITWLCKIILYGSSMGKLVELCNYGGSTQFKQKWFWALGVKFVLWIKWRGRINRGEIETMTNISESCDGRFVCWGAAWFSACEARMQRGPWNDGTTRRCRSHEAGNERLHWHESVKTHGNVYVYIYIIIVFQQINLRVSFLWH